jgi:hypothetical protein
MGRIWVRQREKVNLGQRTKNLDGDANQPAATDFGHHGKVRAQKGKATENGEGER